VTLTVGGDIVALGGPKQRLVLGLLVARAGQVVPIDDITDALWPEGPQARPRKTVQVYVTRLRGLLGDRSAAIQGVAAGYRFDPALVDLDAAEFEAELDGTAHASDDEAVVTRLRRALGLWRGDAFADLRDCSAIVPSAVRLDGLRLNALHELFDREIRLRPHSVIAEIEHAVEAHPLDEGLAAQLMSAQYRAGRQADALATYQQLRRRLAAELGLEPGRAVRELEGQILRHELAVAERPVVAVPDRQRRRVSIVAAAFELGEAEAEDPEHEFAVLSPLRQAARARVFGHGGMITSESAAGLTACFGYPARGDAAIQAVSAALALRDLADPGSGVRVRVGADNGIVVIEAGGDATTSSVSGITGPPVRAATRLCDDAEVGEVCVGPSLAELVEHDFELRPPSSGGDDSAVVVRRRVRAAERRSSTAGIVDRAPAIEALQAVVDRAVHGLRPVMVTGPPGIGKTAVVEAFVEGLGADWATVLLHAGASHELTPLHAFRTGVPEAFEDGGGEPTARELVAALRKRWDGRRPALVVEDVHLIDPSSLTVLDQLADHLAEGLVAMTSRESRPVELGGERVPAIALGPLEANDARSLARRCAAGQHLDLSTLNEIVERSGGTPLHVVELTRTMIDEVAPVRLPATLYDSLMWRLDRLGPARAVTQRCAVLGGSFTVDDVVELTDVGSPAEATEHLQTMVDRGVLRVTDGRYRFVSALLADAAYESVLQRDRQDLHARIADAITGSARRHPVERLAFHLEASGRAAEAAVAWRRAASVALRQHANREAMHHAQRAIRLIDGMPPSDDPGVGETLAKALTVLAIGMHATVHGSQELADVVARARAESSRSTLVLDLIDISNRQALGDLLGATEVAEETLRRADDEGDEMGAAFARHFLGATLLFRGELDTGAAALEQAAAFWERDAEPGPVSARPVGALWALLALVHTLRGNDVASTQCVARARAVIAVEDGDGRCLVAATSAIIDQLCDRSTTVREHLEPVWLLATEIGSEFWLGWAQTLLGWAIAADDSLAGRAMMIEAFESQTTVQALPYFGYLLGARQGEAGEVDDAIATLDAAIDLATTTGELLWQPLLLHERARWRDAAGDPGAAADAAEALEVATRMGASRIVDKCRSWSPSVST
jgi:DNA-binding SARP family transcriptional activator